MAHRQCLCWLAACVACVGVAAGAAAQSLPTPVEPLPWDATAYDPAVDGPSSAFGPAGWFFAAEVGVVKPCVGNRLVGFVPMPDAPPRPIRLPGASLDATVAPRFEIGYRLPSGLGSFLLSYRFLASSGRDTVPNFDILGAAALRSRLDLNAVDLDYTTTEAEPAPFWQMTWHAGVRFANVFYDTRADGPFVDRRLASRFVGAGPRLGLDLRRTLPAPGLALFLRTEGAVAVGRARQSVGEAFPYFDSGSAAVESATRASPAWSLQAGLGWTPAGWDGTRLTLGYLYEHWWYLGVPGDSRLELEDQGVFLRAEYRY